MIRSRTECDRMLSEIQAALLPLEAKYNVKFRATLKKFSVANIDILIHGVDSTDEDKTVEREDFELYAPRYGLDASDYGRVVTINERQYAIVGWNSAARTNKIMLQQVSAGKACGKIFVTSPKILKQYLQ